MNKLIDILALIIIYKLIFYRKWRRYGERKFLAHTFLYIYICFVLYFTLMPILTSLPHISSHPYTPMNLVPFIDVILGRGDYIRQIILNILMTVPFGFLLPLTGKKNMKLAKVFFYTFLLSLAIELLQPFINSFRASDITDLITNTCGGVIGYFLYRICKGRPKK